MVDACGGKIIHNDPFARQLAPHRKRLGSVFRYSSTCVRSIPSGRWPDPHHNWCSFVYDPAISPFRFIHLFDFTEKKSPLLPGGMNRGPNIFDFLTAEQIPYFVSDPALTGEENCDRLPARLRIYEDWIAQLLEATRQQYAEVRLYIFSDHGMANCDQLLDPKAQIDALPVVMEKDYAVVYDSTTARFWFFNDRARHLITEALGREPQGRMVPDAELKELRALFEDRYFGELICLVKEGVLIVPSHRGERPIRAMHGYHPTDPHSYASLLTNQPSVPAEITAIPLIHQPMESTARLAREKNGATSAT
jgi:Type I phosphodiesterase / nucleotide pyrophosphatase